MAPNKEAVVVETTEKTEEKSLVARLEEEGDVAADYLEGLLDIADLDGDIEIGMENDRATLSIEGGNPPYQVQWDHGPKSKSLSSSPNKALSKAAMAV